MSLDISLHLPPQELKPVTDNGDGTVDVPEIEYGEEVLAMNWLRNPYGLERWAEGNFRAVGAKADTKLHYVVNNWNYDSSYHVDRKLFKSVVDQYWRVIQKLDRGYFFFDVRSYIQFIEPHRDQFPEEKSPISGEVRIKHINYSLGDMVGIPMEYFHEGIINLHRNEDHLNAYKDWFYELVQFAEKLQDNKLLFYCSN